jgi:hypothetical protein
MFVIAASIATVALALVAAHAPGRIRLLGLYSIAFGLLLAWIQIRLAAFLQIKVTSSVIAIIGLLTLAGLVTSACQTVALQPQPKVDDNFHPVAALVAAQLEKESPGTEKEVAPSFPERFQSYLVRRVDQFGNWSSPWPEVMWACEVFLGTGAAIFLAIQCREPKALPS